LGCKSKPALIQRKRTLFKEEQNYNRKFKITVMALGTGGKNRESDCLSVICCDLCKEFQKVDEHLKKLEGQFKGLFCGLNTKNVHA